MRLGLRGTWSGEPAPGACGGEVRVLAAGTTVSFEWDVALPAPPRIPDGPPAFHDGLWEHDVVELFLTACDPSDPEPRYLELEIGPAGHWLALLFSGVRRRDRELREPAPVVESRVDGFRWHGSAVLEVPAECARPGAPWRGLACLATAAEGRPILLTSQPLPGERADFHRPAAWSRITAGRAASRG